MSSYSSLSSLSINSLMTLTIIAVMATSAWADVSPGCDLTLEGPSALLSSLMILVIGGVLYTAHRRHHRNL